MESPQHSLEQALGRFAQLVHRDPALAEEWRVSRAEFFGEGSSRAASDELAQRRHLEWFVLERHSASLLGTPGDRLIDVWRALHKGPEREELGEVEHALFASFSGVFEVGDVRPGVGAWLRDVAGFGEFALSEPGGSAGLHAGDLLVGRLFPIGGGVHHASRASGLFQNPRLREALEADLARVRENGGPKILRLAAPELESMFWGAGRVEVSEDPVGDARKLLTDGGVSQVETSAILRRLGAAPFDPSRLVIGAADTLGEILSELAFDTEVDLAAARSVLTHAWAALASRAPGAAQRASTAAQPQAKSPAKSPSAAEARDDEAVRRAAVDAFAAGRASGQDLEQLFAELESSLELGREGGDEDPGQAPDFPGVVGAMIEEFRWELEAGGDPKADEHAAALGEFARFAEPIGWFEEVDAQALLRYCAFWVPEQGRFESPEGVRAMLDGLEEFCAWADDAHGLDIGQSFASRLEGLRSNLPRIVMLNRAFEAPAPNPDDPGELYEVRAKEASRVTLASLQGNETVVDVDAALYAGLAPQDRLRARIALDGTTSVYCVYPAEAAGLLTR